nr:hypothetical protein [Lentzea aerocolonigenes]
MGAAAVRELQRRPIVIVRQRILVDVHGCWTFCHDADVFAGPPPAGRPDLGLPQVEQPTPVDASCIIDLTSFARHVGVRRSSLRMRLGAPCQSVRSHIRWTRFESCAASSAPTTIQSSSKQMTSLAGNSFAASAGDRTQTNSGGGLPMDA